MTTSTRTAGVEQGLVDLVDRGLNEFGGVEGDFVAQALGELVSELVIFARTRLATSRALAPGN